MTQNRKQITLACGSVDGFRWALRKAVHPLSHNFAGHFVLDSALDKYKNQIRNKDGKWLKSCLPASYRGLYEIHHNWQDGARVQLLTRDQHQALHAILRTRKSASDAGESVSIKSATDAGISASGD